MISVKTLWQSHQCFHQDKLNFQNHLNMGSALSPTVKPFFKLKCPSQIPALIVDYRHVGTLTLFCVVITAIPCGIAVFHMLGSWVKFRLRNVVNPHQLNTFKDSSRHREECYAAILDRWVSLILPHQILCCLKKPIKWTPINEFDSQFPIHPCRLFRLSEMVHQAVLLEGVYYRWRPSSMGGRKSQRPLSSCRRI